jgi:hypothetical protein
MKPKPMELEAYPGGADVDGKMRIAQLVVLERLAREGVLVGIKLCMVDVVESFIQKRP